MAAAVTYEFTQHLPAQFILLQPFVLVIADFPFPLGKSSQRPLTERMRNPPVASVALSEIRYRIHLADTEVHHTFDAQLTGAPQRCGTGSDGTLGGTASRKGKTGIYPFHQEGKNLRHLFVFSLLFAFHLL